MTWNQCLTNMPGVGQNINNNAVNNTNTNNKRLAKTASHAENKKP